MQDKFELWYLNKYPSNFGHKHTLSDIKSLRSGDGYWGESYTCFGNINYLWEAYQAGFAASEYKEE